MQQSACVLRRGASSGLMLNTLARASSATLRGSSCGFLLPCIGGAVAVSLFGRLIVRLRLRDLRLVIAFYLSGFQFVALGLLFRLGAVRLFCTGFR